MSRFLSKRLLALSPYVAGEQPQDMQYVKLNTNESPYPPSPGVIQRLSEAEAGKLNLYPDPEGRALRQKLAEYYGLKSENVVLGNGSDEILSFAFSAFCDGENPVTYPATSYGFYPVFAALYGLRAREVPLREDFSIDPEDYKQNDAMVVIANPNAPTGLALDLDEIEGILQANPDRVVVVDEAYVDFGAQSAVALIPRYENLLVVQTFSKARSMAGARLGYGLGSEALICDLQTIRNSTNPYNVNRLTLLAGEAALDDAAYYEENCRTIQKTRAFAAEELKKRGFVLTDSLANFLFAKCPGLPGKRYYQLLKERGVLVRHFDKPVTTDYVRITVGSLAQMQRLLEATDEILARPED